MLISVLTLFPKIFEAAFSESILRIAQEKSAVKFETHNLRNWGLGKRKTVDDRPYGGGAGMVLRPEPVFSAVEEITKEGNWRKILLSPQGKKLTHESAFEISKEDKLLLVCGHYEGIDERIHEGLELEEISIGDYVTTGGELPALVIIDTVVRFLPNVLGNEQSTTEESFSRGLLEYPQYTRPVDFRGMKVPDILKSGNHKEIAQWREAMAHERTLERRPDLLL
ncbi:MAG: tRNA (guanosine(37)-N1)-methyltransferase TrmD [Planctomycetota bacterium]